MVIFFLYVYLQKIDVLQPQVILVFFVSIDRFDNKFFCLFLFYILTIYTICI